MLCFYSTIQWKTVYSACRCQDAIVCWSIKIGKTVVLTRQRRSRWPNVNRRRLWNYRCTYPDNSEYSSETLHHDMNTISTLLGPYIKTKFESDTAKFQSECNPFFTQMDYIQRENNVISSQNINPLSLFIQRSWMNISDVIQRNHMSRRKFVKGFWANIQNPNQWPV